MRRRLSFAVAAFALAAPVAAASAVHGCSDEEPFESVCLWVADPDNCYRAFREDSVDNGETCKPIGDPSPVDTSTGDNGTANGAFLGRDKLDICYIGGGGQVVFDPPLDLSLFPPPLLATPTTYKMTFKRADGTECGSASYTSPHGFSFTINAPANVDASAPTSSTDGGTADAGDAGVPIPYGSYTQVIQPGRDAFDVTCPSGEAHHFNLFEVEGATVTSDGGVETNCPLFANVVPQATFSVNPGGIGVPGAVSFTIYWPPTGSESDAGYPDAALLQTGTPLQPTLVTYFNCSIDAEDKPCSNGAKDGNETDIDCGGAETQTGCPARCGDGQGCVRDCDCDTALTCNVVAGVRVCGVPTGADGGPTAAPARDCSAFIVCQNGKKDASETDVDCGGTECPQCVDGQTCLVNGDCKSGYCFGGKCSTPNCGDNIKNLGEIDVDCGGPCPPCANGKDCTMNVDCASGNCVNNKCDVAKCDDAVKNGTETDVDCGGGACNKCPNLKACLVNTDCLNNACVNGVCLFPSCSDSTKDGNETDVDCGGNKCDKCADGLLCTSNLDCQSGLCGPAALVGNEVISRCFPATCGADGGMGGGASMATCGGGACPLCDNGAGCKTNSDCLYQGCVNGACATATCNDLVQDGSETDVDCGGGKCLPCDPGKDCLSNSDCNNGVDGGVGTCINKVCQ
ncbi:MAG: hypothetical protein QM820_62740 [Minicystis sp.]